MKKRDEELTKKGLRVVRLAVPVFPLVVGAGLVSLYLCNRSIEKTGTGPPPGFLPPYMVMGVEPVGLLRSAQDDANAFSMPVEEVQASGFDFDNPFDVREEQISNNIMSNHQQPVTKQQYYPTVVTGEKWTRPLSDDGTTWWMQKLSAYL